jgi:hypothetical protein
LGLKYTRGVGGGYAQWHLLADFNPLWCLPAPNKPPYFGVLTRTMMELASQVAGYVDELRQISVQGL